MTASVTAAAQRSRTQPVAHELDAAAQQVFQDTGQVCLVAGLARCLLCSESMSVRLNDSNRAVHVCGLKGSLAHPVPVEALNSAVWSLHIASSPRSQIVTDLAHQRAVIWRTYAAVTINPDPDTTHPIMNLYHRSTI